jgi:hypothetical protein
MKALRVCFGLIVVASLGAGVGGCIKAQAKTAPDGPPLEMPAPPPRVIAPADEPIVAAPAEPTEPAPAPTSTTRKPPRRAQPSAESTQKPVETAPPAELPLPQAAPEPTNPTPAPTLRAPGTAEKPVRDRLTEAQRDLARVDYAKLSPDGRNQYEQSKRFVQQAEQALKDQNFVFAQTLADKAANIAAELLGR